MIYHVKLYSKSFSTRILNNFPTSSGLSFYLVLYVCKVFYLCEFSPVKPIKDEEFKRCSSYKTKLWVNQDTGPSRILGSLELLIWNVHEQTYSFLLWTFCHVLSLSSIHQSGKCSAITFPFSEPNTHYPSDSSSQNKSLNERSAWLKICELLIHLTLYCIQLKETHRLFRNWFTRKI